MLDFQPRYAVFTKKRYGAAVILQRKVFGRLPVCPKRLSLLGVIAGLAAGVAAALIKLFLLS